MLISRFDVIDWLCSVKKKHVKHITVLVGCLYVSQFISNVSQRKKWRTEKSNIPMKPGETGWCPKTSGLHGYLSYPRADISPAICGVIPHRTWTPKTNPSTRQKRQSVIMRIIKHDPKCLVDVSIFSIMISESCTPHISKTCHRLSPVPMGSNFSISAFSTFQGGEENGDFNVAELRSNAQATQPGHGHGLKWELYQALNCQWLRRLRHQSKLVVQVLIISHI